MSEASMSIEGAMARAVAAYREGMAGTKAAQQFGVSRHHLYKVLRFANLTRPSSERRPTYRGPVLTEEEIWSQAAAIRAAWTSAERAKRWVGNRAPDARMERMYQSIQRRRGCA